MSEVPPPRVITQIAAVAGSPDVLFALADDGTVWRLAVRLDYTWAQLPALPAAEDPVGRTPSTPV